ncbi:MAG: hypothetical protein ACOC6J_05750 [Spirochaetota bacterium]
MESSKTLSMWGRPSGRARASTMRGESATCSPDGTRLAFVSNTVPFG